MSDSSENVTLVASTVSVPASVPSASVATTTVKRGPGRPAGAANTKLAQAGVLIQARRAQNVARPQILEALQTELALSKQVAQVYYHKHTSTKVPEKRGPRKPKIVAAVTATDSVDNSPPTV